MARALLLAYEQPHEIIKHDSPEEKAAFKAQGFKSFPQVFRNGVLIGGYDELHTHLTP